MILKYTSPEAVPVSFKLGRRKICGIPEEFSPKVSREFVDSNIQKITVEGKNRSGLTIRADYTEYRDFPVTEWVFYFTNNGESDTARLENIRIKGKFRYAEIESLSTEARQKLTAIDPETLAQASRIPGVSPSDINVLLILVRR